MTAIDTSQIDFLKILEPITYDQAVNSIAEHIKDKHPESTIEQLKTTIHGLYLRIALRDHLGRIPLIDDYLQRNRPDVHQKMAGLSQENIGEQLKGLFINEHPELLPDVNRLLLMSGLAQLPPIRNNLGGMQQFVDSVRHSLATGNWFGALFMALALPDICAAVEHGRTTGARYEDWFDRYLKTKYDPLNSYEFTEARMPGITADWSEETIKQAQQPDPRMAAWRFTASDCYQFRCKTLHQGLPQRDKNDTNKILFSPPTGAIFHQSLIGGQWWLSIDIFCTDMCLAVEKWLVDIENDTTMQARLAELMTI